MTSRNNIALKRQSFEIRPFLSSLPVPFPARACKDTETTVRDDLAIQIRAAHETFILVRFPSLLADLQIEILKSNRVIVKHQRGGGTFLPSSSSSSCIVSKGDLHIHEGFPKISKSSTRLFQYREYYILVRNNSDSGEY